MTDTEPRNEASSGFGPGSRVGAYRVVRELGRGGMGVVYLAEHENLGRRVALKLLAARHAASDKALERFEREVRAVARLADPNIVGIYEVGRFDDVPYFTMEFVEGRTLHELLQDLRQAQRAPQTLRASDLSDSWFSAGVGTEIEDPQRRTWIGAACAVVARIADALSHVHAQGVVHRDVKPKNILLARDGRVLLFDFGVARVDTEASMTISGEFVGTPYYVSPEQVDPPEAGVDERTDIYSLGVTLYELLTLQVPFDGESPQQIFRRIQQREPRAVRRLNPQVPRDLETVCQMAMAKERGRRYQSAADFAADLRRFLTLKPVFARSLGPLGRVALWTRRKPAAAALTLAGLVLVALLGQTWRQRGEIRRERLAHALASFRYAQVLQQQGRFADALAELAEASSGGHDPVAVSVLRIETLEAAGDDAAALRELAWLRGRRDLGALAGKVALLAGDLGSERLRDPDAGLELVRRALASGELSDPDASYARSLLAANAHEALRALEETLARQPLHVRARASYGPTLLSLGRRREAVVFAERMVDSHPEDLRVLLFSAMAHALAGDPKRAGADLDAAGARLDGRAEVALRAWADHLSVATQGADALQNTALHGAAAHASAAPIDPPRLMIALSELLTGVEVVDADGRVRSLRFRLPPAVARGYSKLVQAFAAHSGSELSESDREPVLRLLDEALAVHPDGFRFLLRGLLGHPMRGLAALLDDLDRASRTPSMLAVERPALFLLLRAQSEMLRELRRRRAEPQPAAGIAAAAHERSVAEVVDAVRLTLRRVLAVPALESDALPLLLDAARLAQDHLLARELLLRWQRESPASVPSPATLRWLLEGDAERAWQRLFGPR
ncbi:MAG: serine/threonine-protein kinase [Planctomycetota bacterium]